MSRKFAFECLSVVQPANKLLQTINAAYEQLLLWASFDGNFVLYVN